MSSELDKLKAALEAAGFRTERNDMRDPANECTWHAWRRLPDNVTNCECNDKPPSLRVKPYSFELQGRRHESATLEIVGEAGAVWFTLSAYSLKPSEVMERLSGVEASLTTAWQSLARH